MSDFDYRNEGNYEEESINESDIRIESAPVKAGQTSPERSRYRDSSYSRQSDDRYYRGEPSFDRQFDSGYDENGFQSDGNASYYSGSNPTDDGNAGFYSNSQQAGSKSGRRYSHIPEEPVKNSKKKTKKKGSWFSGALKAASFALIFGVVAGGAFAGVNSVKDHFSPSTSAKIETIEADSDDKADAAADSTESVVADNGTTSAIPQDASAVVENVMPSVVSITGTYRTNNAFGFGSQESQGAGSGFIIAENDDKLFLATNNHVVENSSSLTVGFIDETTAPATVVGRDSNIDVAVISVNKKDLSDDTAKKIKIATLGSSDDLKLGEPVIVIGNALGYGQSVTYGVLSAKDREVSFADGTMSLLQTDAAINPGNSGGVMINLKGEVVGISNAKLEDTSIEGMCYAVPISEAKVILTDLMNAGDIDEKDASYLGIVGKNIDASYSKALGMPQGIYISQIVSKSPAEESGIKAGDIIVAMDGTKISTMDGLKQRLALKKAGTKVVITVKRTNQNGEYKEKKIKVTLGKASDFQDAINSNQQQNNNNDSQNQNGGQDINPFGNGNGNGSGNDSGDYYFYDDDNGNGNGNGSSDDPFYYFFNY